MFKSHTYFLVFLLLWFIVSAAGVLINVFFKTNILFSEMVFTSVILTLGSFMYVEMMDQDEKEKK